MFDTIVTVKRVECSPSSWTLAFVPSLSYRYLTQSLPGVSHVYQIKLMVVPIFNGVWYWECGLMKRDNLCGKGDNSSCYPYNHIVQCTEYQYMFECFELKWNVKCKWIQIVNTLISSGTHLMRPKVHLLGFVVAIGATHNNCNILWVFE